ncbi:MAG: S-layer homology domain-containing protein [Dehalobacterium sp.]
MRKLFTALMIIGLLISSVPSVFAANETQGRQEITLEKAIEISKGLFPVSESFDQFDSTYEQDEYAHVWSLRWYKDKGEGELNVRVNAVSGEIAGYRAYDPADYSGEFSSIPKVSREAGEKNARDFIKKAAPSKVGEIVLKPNNNSYYGGPVFHNYSFVRTLNGIEYPANNIHVEVNGQTGQVRNFYLTWEDITHPKETAKLSQQDAEKIFTEKFGFELKYFRPQANSTEIKPIMTIYEINNPAQVSIDALTGEIVQDSYYGIYTDESMGGAGAAKEMAADSSLAPFEQKIADELNELISREKALEIAEKTIEIPKNYRLNSSNLTKDWNFPELRIWSFDWSLEEKDYYGWASVEIDAKTGKVLSFNYREKDAENQSEKRPLKIKTKIEAEKIVNKYLEENYPEVVGNLRLQADNYEVRPLNEEEEKNQPSYYFQYERLVDQVPFSQNYVRATVDSYTGKITSFRMRFLELDFPKTDNVLEKSQFTADFFAKNQMTLVYTKDQDRKLRLVYKLASLDSYRFNALNGQMLDYNGQPMQDKKAGEITDISGHWAEQDINTLNQFGFLHYEKGLFQPDGLMTQAELIKALVKSRDSYITDSTEGNWYDSYYRQAKQSGLITEKEVDPEASLTREQMAKFITRTVVGDKIARLDIYQISYQDGAKISQGYQGYIAIVSGLGIMTGDGANFNPQVKVKRGEACAVLMRYLRLEK